MSDFPSIEEFDAGQTTTKFNTGGEFSSDLDFLAREKAALGNDAELFGSADPVHIPSTMVADADMATFESDFPPIDVPQTIPESVPQGIFGSQIPFNAPPTQSLNFEPDSEPIREWREKQRIMITERDTASDRKKQQIIKEAQEAIDEFYENYGKKKIKAIEENKREEEELERSREDITSGSQWERIVRLLDLGGPQSKAFKPIGTRDISRMKEVFLSLKSDPKAPEIGVKN